MVNSRRVQVGEIWSFIHVKQENVATANRLDLVYRDTWTWTAIDADAKLLITLAVGMAITPWGFMNDSKSRTTAQGRLLNH